MSVSSPSSKQPRRHVAETVEFAKRIFTMLSGNIGRLSAFF